MKTYTIYLFRHGLTKGNLNAQYIGHTDLPLTTDSISSLRNIKAHHHYPTVQAVFTSPLKRCIEREVKSTGSFGRSGVSPQYVHGMMHNCLQLEF